MKGVYFRINSVPEVRLLPREARARVVRRSFDEIKQVPCSHVVAWVLVPLLVVLSLLLAYPFAKLVVFFFAIPPVMTGPVLGCVLAGQFAAVLWIQAHAVDADRRLLREGLARYSPSGRLPICAVCDYDLRGSVSDRCPECGARVIVSQRVSNGQVQLPGR